MSSPTVDIDLLNRVNDMAFADESNDHINCQMKNLQALKAKNNGRLTGYEFQLRRDPMGTGNPLAVFVSLKIYDFTKPSEPDIEQRTAPVKVLGQLQRFTCFGQLLPELRSQIWAHALPDTQVIELYRTGSDLFNGHMSEAARKTLITLLTTCLESYEIVRLYYKRMAFDVSSLAAAKASSMLINPKTDVLYLSAADQVSLNISNRLRTAQTSHFTTLAMPASVLKFFLVLDNDSSFMPWMASLANLKTLLIITRESHEQHGEELSLVPYKGDECDYQKLLIQMWGAFTKRAGRDIELVWVDPYRNGVRVIDAFHAH